MEMAGTVMFFTLGISLLLSTTTAPTPIPTIMAPTPIPTITTTTAPTPILTLILMILTPMRRRQYASHQEYTRLTAVGAIIQVKCHGVWGD